MCVPITELNKNISNKVLIELGLWTKMRFESCWLAYQWLAQGWWTCAGWKVLQRQLYDSSLDIVF